LVHADASNVHRASCPGLHVDAGAVLTVSVADAVRPVLVVPMNRGAVVLL
jgi:hypothetical protein